MIQLYFCYFVCLKRVRFSTSVLFSLSIGVELLTPVFPKYFLLLASVANIAKQISLACYLATGVRIFQLKTSCLFIAIPAVASLNSSSDFIDVCYSVQTVHCSSKLCSGR